MKPKIMKPPANPITKTNGLTNKRKSPNGNQQKDVNQKNTTETPATNKRRKYEVAAKVDSGLRRKPTSKINNNNPEPQPSTSTAAAKPAAIVKQQRPVRQPVRKPSQVKAQPLSIDKGVFKFTAQPVAIAKKPISKPRQTPNERQSIARRPVPSSNSVKPKISVAEPSTAKRQLVKPTTYYVKAKVDTGLKKKEKEKEDDIPPDQKIYFVQDLNNPTPSTSKGATLNPLLQYYTFKSRGFEPPLYCHSLDDLRQRAYERDQEKKKPPSDVIVKHLDHAERNPKRVTKSRQLLLQLILKHQQNHHSKKPKSNVKKSLRMM